MSGEGRRGLRPQHSHPSALWALRTRPVPVTHMAHGSGHERRRHCTGSNAYNVPCAGSGSWGQEELAWLLLRTQSGIWPKLRREVQVLAESSPKIVPGDWNPPLSMTFPWGGVSFLLLFGLRTVFLCDLSSQLRKKWCSFWCSAVRRLEFCLHLRSLKYSQNYIHFFSFWNMSVSKQMFEYSSCSGLCFRWL